MLAHLLAAHNVPFLLALGLFGALGALQLISLALGSELFSFLDDVTPDADAHVDVEHGSLGGALDVLGVGKVPAIISLLLLLFFFSFVGYNLQLLVGRFFGAALTPWLAAPIAFAGALPLLRLGNDLCARFLPRDESSAVSEATFIGKVATITIGTVSYERASEAKLKDEHDHTHYVQVVADAPGASFRAGEEVIIVGRRGVRFTVVPGVERLLEEENQ